MISSINSFKNVEQCIDATDQDLAIPMFFIRIPAGTRVGPPETSQWSNSAIGVGQWV